MDTEHRYMPFASALYNRNVLENRQAPSVLTDRSAHANTHFTLPAFFQVAFGGGSPMYLTSTLNS